MLYTHPEVEIAIIREKLLARLLVVVYSTRCTELLESRYSTTSVAARGFASVLDTLDTLVRSPSPPPRKFLGLDDDDDVFVRRGLSGSARAGVGRAYREAHAVATASHQSRNSEEFAGEEGGARARAETARRDGDVYRRSAVPVF